MDRLNCICRHSLFVLKMNAITRAERDRIYCRHDLSHLMDVARLMYMRVLEEEFPAADKSVFSKELVYAAALLHDIGRADQYENGTPHDEAGAAAAKIILQDCGFDPEETELIVNAIRRHRGTEEHIPVHEPSAMFLFADLLKEADKRSRLCFACDARGTCKWPDEKKNMEILL